jgi:hypothetical protein
MELTELSRQVQVKLHQYCNKFKGGVTKPEYKFIRQMLFGILKGGSVQLSSIGRHISDSITHKKTTERLGRHLGKSGFWKKVTELTLQSQEYYLRRCRYLICDTGDIRKRYAEKMEGLGKVHDGSEGEVGVGYWSWNIVGVDERGDMIVPAYSELYSLEVENTSENAKILSGIEAVYEKSSPEAISVLDRGGDRGVLLKALLSMGRYFIIRQRGDRHIFYREEKLSVKQISRGVRLIHRFEVLKRRDNRVERVSYRCGAVPVRLTLSGKKLYLVVVKEDGKGYCWYLCHLSVGNSDEAVRLAFRGYGYRWKIEEIHRQTKGDYDLEGICLQRYEALKAMNALFWAAVSFLYTRLESLSKEILFQPLLSLVKKNRISELYGFIYYKLALGLKLILSGTRLYRELICPLKSNQLCLDFRDT